jgi:hypothetical protein
MFKGVARTHRPISSLPETQWKSKACLRPVRFHSPTRIELDPSSERRIVHNYGHGGSGVTFFWGSALVAYELTAKSAEHCSEVTDSPWQVANSRSPNVLNNAFLVFRELGAANPIQYTYRLQNLIQ